MAKNLIFSLACVLVLVTAAYASYPKTATDFNNQCITSVGGAGSMGNCGDVKGICNDYVSEIGKTFSSRAQCLAMCAKIYNQQNPAHAADSCASHVSHAFSLCGEFCVHNFPR